MTRLAQLQERMAALDVDLIALGPSSDMQWLLGFSPHADERLCLLLISPNRAVFVAPALNAEDMKARCDLEFFTWDDAEGPHPALRQAMTSVGGSIAHLALGDTLRADHALTALGEIAPQQHSFLSAVIGPLRMIKDANEIALLRENAQIADQAHLAVRHALEERGTALCERDLVRVARDSFDAHGATLAFGIVGCGPNGAYPHHKTGMTPIAAHVPIVVDIGATKGGYYSDITRMMSLGPVSQAYLDHHRVVDAAVRAAIETVRPGVEACAVDHAARQVIADAGLGAYFVHRTGHGVGGDIHEAPYITSSNDMPLEAGMVFTIEPGVYLPGAYGIRLEEVVVVTETGCEILSHLSRDIHVA